MLKLKTTPAQLANVYLPFCGFYESIIAAAIDDEIQREIEYFSEDEAMQLSYDDFDVNYHELHTDIAKELADYYPARIKDHTGLDISCQFEELWSPREYNFETDRVYCVIPNHDINRLLNWLISQSKEFFPAYVEKKLKPCSGFIPFYDNDVKSWGHFDSWDNVQKSIVLEAVNKFIEGEYPDFYDTLTGDFWDYWNGHSSISFYMIRITGAGMSEVMEA